MKVLICLVLAAVATTTVCGQALNERPNELADGVSVLSDILTDKKKSYYVRNGHYDD